MYLFLGSQERVRNSYGKRAISVRAIEVLLYCTPGSLRVPRSQVRNYTSRIDYEVMQMRMRIDLNRSLLSLALSFFLFR